MTEDKRPIYAKKYYLRNQERFQAYSVDYYNANQTALLEKQNKYYYDNRDKVLSRLRAKDTCICGAVVCHGGMHAHVRTPKHIKRMTSTPPQVAD